MAAGASVVAMTVLFVLVGIGRIFCEVTVRVQVVRRRCRHSYPLLMVDMASHWMVENRSWGVFG